MVIYYSLITLILLLVYIFFLLYLRRGFNHLIRAERLQHKPMISVVVCAHNEQKNLPDCINLLSIQTYDKDKVEFILVNDRSTDKTKEIIDTICKTDQRF